MMPEDRSAEFEAMRRDIEADYDRIFEGVLPPDEVDAAIATLRSARRIVADGQMMAAIKKRQDENRAAIAQQKGATNG